jgi:hypothetical protein
MSIVTCTLDSTRKIINLQKTNSQTNEKSQWCHIFKFFLILFYFCLVGMQCQAGSKAVSLQPLKKIDGCTLSTAYRLQLIND